MLYYTKYCSNGSRSVRTEYWYVLGGLAQNYSESAVSPESDCCLKYDMEGKVRIGARTEDREKCD